MKTQLQLDYPAILANTARPVHLALTFDAPEITGSCSTRVPFVAVVDRSGSMGRTPIEAAKRAARTVVRNIRRSAKLRIGILIHPTSTTPLSR